METTLTKSTARDFFLYLFTVGVLYVCIGTFTHLLFEYIDRLFPDVLSSGVFGYSSAIRFSIAALIILFPVYIGLTWYLRKDIISHPEKRDLRVRKWLLYLTLFFAAVAILVDLVTLIFHFLDGELTIRFFLKVLAVLFVAGSVFAYYFWDLKREVTPDSKPSKILAWSASVVVLGTIVAGFFIVGSPFTQRQRRMDDIRVQHLMNIQNQIVYNHWTQKGQLPVTLDELKDSISGFTPPKDPETEKPYEYRVTGARNFQLCADFSLASSDESQDSMPHFYDGSLDNWKHEKGRVCFDRTIDPQLYPPKKP